MKRPVGSRRRRGGGVGLRRGSSSCTIAWQAQGIRRALVQASDWRRRLRSMRKAIGDGGGAGSDGTGRRGGPGASRVAGSYRLWESVGFVAKPRPASLPGYDWIFSKINNVLRVSRAGIKMLAREARSSSSLCSERFWTSLWRHNGRRLLDSSPFGSIVSTRRPYRQTRHSSSSGGGVTCTQTVSCLPQQPES